MGDSQDNQPPAAPSDAAPPQTPDLAHTRQQPNNPLHGVTLEVMLRYLLVHLGWAGLAERIPARCFSDNPSMGSSLKFLRKTPWARDKVEGLYLHLVREHARRGRRKPPG